MRQLQVSGEDVSLDGRRLSYRKTLLQDSLSSSFSQALIAVWDKSPGLEQSRTEIAQNTHAGSIAATW